MSERPVIIHHLDHAIVAVRQAERLRCPITLQSAPHAVYYAGPLYLKELFTQAKESCPNTETTFVIDCADDGALALIALKLGHTHLRLNANEKILSEIAAAATENGAILLPAPHDTLDLLTHWNPVLAVEKWLKAT